MLKLKRVEIQGFKSFYDRTEMKFNGSGIAAVVGPNGCGKSNLSDAISWVLGEQSAKLLRGARMEDVIFAGTRDKRALSMAAVTMTLVPGETAIHSTAAAPPQHQPEPPASAETEPFGDVRNEEPAAGESSEPETNHVNGSSPLVAIRPEVLKAAERRGEVTITRRLYRSGESEYLVNGRTARLRDIQELFLGTGLGPESYAIIEQGRIGQILSNKPQDRRNVIEEAAGITKFKNRKRLAEAKLESAKQNLSRVFDILEEVNRQVNSLKRQAAKTKRYSELKAEAIGYLRQVLTARFQILERETARVAIELNLVSAEWQTGQAAIAQHEREQQAGAEESYVIEQELTRARQELAQLQVEAERARGQFESQAKQIQQIEHRFGASDQEERQLSRQSETVAAELAQGIAALQAIETELLDAREQSAARAAERQAAQSRLQEQERGLEASRQRVLRLLGESSALKNRITQGEAQLASADRDTQRAQAEEQQSESDLARIQKIKAELSERLTARQMELTSVAEQRQDVEAQISQNRARLHETRQTFERLRGEFSRIKARRDSLEDVIEHRSYTTETVKRLFTAVQGGKAPDFKPVGVLADFLEVDPQFEKATEEFLHDELEYVVVRDWAEAERGIELMRTELNGRATFLVEDPGTAAAPRQNVPAPELEAGRITRLTDLLRFTNGLSNISLDGLPRIANCYITAERELAQGLAGQFPQCWFLAADGVSYQGQMASGGKKTGAGPLALKRELREVSQLEKTKESELSAVQDDLAQLERTLATLAEQLEQLRGQQQWQEKDALALDHESRKLAEEFQRVQARLSHARLELDRISRDRVKVQEGVARDHTELERNETARAEQEEALVAAREELGQLQADLALATEEHSSLRASLASLEERQRSLSATRSRLEIQTRDLTNRRENLQHERQRLAAEHEHLVSSNRDLEARRLELAAAMASNEKRVAELARQEADSRSRLAEIEEQLRRLRTEAHYAQERRSELQVSLARAESDLKHLEATCQQELETSLAELARKVETVPDHSTIEQLDAAYGEIRRKIEALGPVNPQALEEFEEAQTRQEFLNRQRQDLLDSIRDTETAIHEIDGESRKRFTEAFKLINENFREMFKTLFGGGTGEMRLTDEENAGESGIDIVASPPGKKLQSVLLLSGGEKSLTAMALLMAIFQYMPSPFCVLDEVDAPLDEPNIERLTKLIREMATQTQFIVITHSKRTMEAAQSLYGVTMQEPGISKLVSVKFDKRLEQPAVRAEAKRTRQEEDMEVATV